jgi:hypothetical protein
LRDGLDGVRKIDYEGTLQRDAQSTRTLISRHGGNTVLFSAIKDQTPPNKGSATDELVWRKYRMLGGDILQHWTSRTDRAERLTRSLRGFLQFWLIAKSN